MREADGAECGEARVLESLSRLAGGVAHDLNNILLVVQGYTEMALSEEDAGAEVRDLITEAREAMTRAASLVQDLLVAGQRGPFTPRLIDLSEAVRRQLPALHAACGDGIQITISLAADLPPVLLDEDLLGRLLAALCARAREAMPAGGEVTVETSSGGGSMEASRVLLRVGDTGEAIAAEMRGRFFEPYLPGRSGGKGQGLGPLIVHSVVRRLGGEVAVESSDGGGTVFVVSLPGRHVGDVAQVPAADCSPGAAPRPPETAPSSAVLPDPGAATILVAEDDEGLRSLAVKVLSREGYTVIAARDGQEAVDLYERAGGTISLVLLDDVMPRMGGRATLERIRRTAPSLPAILCSGYTWRLDGAPRESDAFCAVLPKPWQPRELIHRVREGLGPGR